MSILAAFLRKSCGMEHKLQRVSTNMDLTISRSTTNLITQHFVRIVKLRLTVLARLTMEASKRNGVDLIEGRATDAHGC